MATPLSSSSNASPLRPPSFQQQCSVCLDKAVETKNKVQTFLTKLESLQKEKKEPVERLNKTMGIAKRQLKHARHRIEMAGEMLVTASKVDKALEGV